MALPNTDAELREALKAYEKHGGNKSAAARSLGLNRITYLDRVDAACKRFKKVLGKVVDGKVDAVEAVQMPLPKPGHVQRYIVTSAQNNTHVHPAWRNLLAYCDFLNKHPKSSCSLIVGTFTYALDAYGKKNVKRGTYNPDAEDELWYAPELVKYIDDRSLELAPALVWCGEQNILPTAQNPLTGFETYNGRASNIVPHAKFAMASVASLPDEATKLNFSTGAITQRNYIQKRVGILAEKMHGYGGLLVEVDSDGNWYVRQLEVIDEAVYDIGPSPLPPVKISRGKVTMQSAGTRYVDAINWGDIHAAEMELWVRHLGWGHGGFLDTLKPKRQFQHDVFSMRSRSHHEEKDFFRNFEKHVRREDSVRDEMKVTADFMNYSARPWVETVVVASNHHDHLKKWLNISDPKKDVLNAEYYGELTNRVLKAIREDEGGFDLLEYALRGAGLAGKFLFLDDDQSYVICEDSKHGGIECGLHGHYGPNGSHGSTRNLAKLGRKVIKNHDHTAAWYGLTTSGGACSLRFVYMKGPHTHTISHNVAFENGARQIITFWKNKYRA